MQDKHRLFFALWPDEAVARQFDELGRRAHLALGGRRMRRDTLHLTLAFLGEVAAERLEALAELAGAIRIPPFEQTFDKAQCLPRKKIFWASASRVATELRELAGALSDRLKAADFRTEARPFAAHVTLLRHARCDRQMPTEELRLVWPVRDFVLVESELSPEGARYRILRRWPLDQT